MDRLQVAVCKICRQFSQTDWIRSSTGHGSLDADSGDVFTTDSQHFLNLVRLCFGSDDQRDLRQNGDKFSFTVLELSALERTITVADT